MRPLCSFSPSTFTDSYLINSRKTAFTGRTATLREPAAAIVVGIWGGDAFPDSFAPYIISRYNAHYLYNRRGIEMPSNTLYNDVFISYSRKDIDFARRIVETLQQNGRGSWIDWGDLSSGSH